MGSVPRPRQHSGKAAPENGIQEDGSSWTAPVVKQPDDRSDREFAPTSQPQVGPDPVRRGGIARCRAFPKYGIADGGYAQLREPVEILDPIQVPVEFELIQEAVADAIDRALQTALHLEGRE